MLAKLNDSNIIRGSLMFCWTWINKRI